MTEAEWEHSESPSEMLAALPEPRESRKLIHFAVACWSHGDWMDEEYQAAVSEVLAEVIGGKKPLRQLICLFGAFSFDTEPTPEWWAGAVTRECSDPGPPYRTQAALLRCIFGNPFRPVAFDPSWRTEAVVALAAGVYADRAFGRLPVLADALEDAGCANPDVLGHCRSDGPHARGCWVVDLVLGKA